MRVGYIDDSGNVAFKYENHSCTAWNIQNSNSEDKIKTQWYLSPLEPQGDIY